MEAIEKNIIFDEEGKGVLLLGQQFKKRKAKVVVLFEDNEEEISDEMWMKLAMKGHAFDFWNDPSEDIYSVADGIPYKEKTDEI